jgi:hypothetical protein
VAFYQAEGNKQNADAPKDIPKLHELGKDVQETLSLKGGNMGEKEKEENEKGQKMDLGDVAADDHEAIGLHPNVHEPKMHGKEVDVDLKHVVRENQAVGVSDAVARGGKQPGKQRGTYKKLRNDRNSEGKEDGEQNGSKQNVKKRQMVGETSGGNEQIKKQKKWMC